MTKDKEMLDEYDFTQGIRGKYSKQYKQGANIIKLDEDVSKYFPNEKTVNEALRTIINLTHKNRARS